MPFKSKSQQRFMFATHPRMAKRWAHETDDIKKLPEKVKKAYEIKPKDRPDIPKKLFAQPNKEEAGHKGKYPIPDAQHYRSALGFAKMHGDTKAYAAIKAKGRAMGYEKEASIEKDLIPGGMADRKSFKDFSKKKIQQGARVEMEHTNKKEVAKEIASDHLTEDPNYYDKLKKMEKKSGAHLFQGLALHQLGERHAKDAMKSAIKRMEAASRKEKHAMNPISLRSFYEELHGIEKSADMLTRRNVAGARGAAQAKANVPAPVQHGFDFGSSTQSTKPVQQVHAPLFQQQRVNQGIAKEQFHARAQRAAQSAVNQPEQTSLNLKTKSERLSAKKARKTKPVPTKTQKVVRGVGKAGKGLLGAGVGLAGAGLLGAGLVAKSMVKQPEEQQQQQQGY